MTRTSPPQVAFSSGELDPLLQRRFDYQRFQTGLAKCRGFLPLPQGAFTRAPGTIHRGATRGNAAGILVPFEFAENDALVLEFTPLKMRVSRVDERSDIYEFRYVAGGRGYTIRRQGDDKNRAWRFRLSDLLREAAR